MNLQEITHADGRSYKVTWCPVGDLPPRSQITQVSAICFTPDDRIVMVTTDGEHWGIPGGHPEDGESCEETLSREVREEACCEVEELELLGWQHVRDLTDDSVHYQMRHCCTVNVRPFRPEYEIRHRKLVAPSDFLSVLEYGDSPIAKELLLLATEAGRQMG